MSIKYRWENNYQILDVLGKGGNAKVYKVIDKKSREVIALKQLTKYSGERKARFKKEIQVMQDNADKIDGIIPIITSCKKNSGTRCRLLHAFQTI